MRHYQRCFCGAEAVTTIEVWLHGNRLAAAPRCTFHAGDKPVVSYVEKPAQHEPTVACTVWLWPRQAEYIEADAEAAGMTITEYLRSLATSPGRQS